MTHIFKFAALSLTALTLAACNIGTGEPLEANTANNDYDATADQTVDQILEGQPPIQ